MLWGIPCCGGFHAVGDTMPCGDTIAAWQVGVHYSGPVAAARVVLAQEGMAGFFRGATVRIGRTGRTRTRSTGRSRR